MWPTCGQAVAAVLLLAFANLAWCGSAEDEETPKKRTVEMWSHIDVTVTGPAETPSFNPFLAVEFGATFTGGDTPIKIAGFYDGSGNYTVRFMPEAFGHWSYKTYR